MYDFGNTYPHQKYTRGKIKSKPTKLQETVDKIKTATGLTEAQQKIIAAQKKGSLTDKIVGGIEAFGAVAKPIGGLAGELAGGVARHFVKGSWRKASEIAKISKFLAVDLPRMPKGSRWAGTKEYLSERLKSLSKGQQPFKRSLSAQYGEVLAKHIDDSLVTNVFKR